MAAGMLSPYRVLDLTDGRAELATFILAGLGADVIKVEPPGGSASRLAPPLADGEPDGLASLAFHAWNRGKRSIVIDLDDLAGRGRFGDLVATSHFVFENAEPGEMAARGLGFDDLVTHRADLVHVAITPFGQTGPYANHLASDLTLAAMGGPMALTGDPDRRPVRITVPQTWLHASAESALAALVAHHRRLLTGRPQFVDMAVQPAMFWTCLNAMIRYAIDGRDDQRCGTELHLSTMQTPLVYPAADGEVCLLPSGATLLGLLPWMLEAGAVTAEWVAGEDWETFERRRLDGGELAIPVAEVAAKVTEFTQSMSKAELFEGAVERGITLMPVNTAADTVAMDHLKTRSYWEEIRLPSGAGLRAPGAFVKLDETPVAWARGAPGIGEHTDEILAELTELTERASGPKPADSATAHPPHDVVDVVDVVEGRPGLAVDAVAVKAADGRPPIDAGVGRPLIEAVVGAPTRGRHREGLPLAGVKVADFSWIGVGPITAKSLADHGATVVRIESAERPDRLRLVGPFRDGEIGIDRCQFFGSFNTSKRSLQLDLKHPTGLDIARRMLAWCDIAIDSFTAGTLDRLGLGYGAARELNPSIIMAETCLFGQTGPLSKLAGYGYHAAAISGFYEVTGWPDRPPGGPWNAYTDTIAPRFLTTVLLAALDHRRRTGQGQYIDQAQMESALHFLGPQLLDVQLSGRSARRDGNQHPSAAPHDTYRCAGDDRWCAIAVETDEQWKQLRSALGDPEWALDPQLDTAAGRRAHSEQIDDALALLTREYQPRDLMDLLQSAGVPAGMVQRSSDLLTDPQLAHRSFFRPMEHPVMGEVPYEGHQYRIAGYDNGPRSPAPCLGEHTFEVLTDLLGLDPDEAVEILASGACT